MPYSHPQSVDRQTVFRQVRHLLPGALLQAANAGFINAVVLGFFKTPVSHMTGAVFWFITHRGVVDLLQDAMPPTPPRTGMFPRM